MKTKRRHELHTNTLADWLGKHAEKLRPYGSWIALGVMAIVVVVIAITYFSGHSEGQLVDGWKRFTDAENEVAEALRQGNDLAIQQATGQLEALARKYSGSPLASFVNTSLGDLYLRRGRSLMNTDRAAALDQLRKAAGYYNAVVAVDNDPVLRNRAWMSLGTTYEWLFKFDDARHAYRQVTGAFEADARQRLAVLDRPETEQLYAQLQKYVPKPPAAPTTRPGDSFGAPGDDLLKDFGLGPKEPFSAPEFPPVKDGQRSPINSVPESGQEKKAPVQPSKEHKGNEAKSPPGDPSKSQPEPSKPVPAPASSTTHKSGSASPPTNEPAAKSPAPPVK